MSAVAWRRRGHRLFTAGWLVGCLLLAMATPCQAQMPSLEAHRGETLADGWQLVDVESHAEFVRLHFARGEEAAHLEINARAQRDGQAHSEYYAIQPAPEGFAPPALQEAVLLLLRDAERTEPAPTSPALRVKVSRVVLLLQLLLALATAFLLVGLAVDLHQRRRLGSEPVPGRSLRAHALPLVVFTTSGALLRVAGGNRVPGFEGGSGHPHGFGDMAALLGERLPRLDSHGSGPAALAELLFALAPQEEATWIALQATLAVLTIPLVYLAALGWLRSTREATWAAAVYALLPCAAYFAMTEVRTVPGAFFVMLSVALTGAAVSAKRASWLASAGLFAVLATSFHPVLAAAPLVMALGLIARDDAAAFVTTPRALLALAGTGAVWAIMLRLLALQLESRGAAQVMGDGVLGPLFDAPRLLLPTLGFAPERPFNAFLNTYSTPPLIGLAWVAGLAALRYPAHRRVRTLAPAVGITVMDKQRFPEGFQPGNQPVMHHPVGKIRGVDFPRLGSFRHEANRGERSPCAEVHGVFQFRQPVQPVAFKPALVDAGLLASPCAAPGRVHGPVADGRNIHTLTGANQTDIVVIVLIVVVVVAVVEVHIPCIVTVARNGRRRSPMLLTRFRPAFTVGRFCDNCARSHRAARVLSVLAHDGCTKADACCPFRYCLYHPPLCLPSSPVSSASCSNW